MGTGKMEILAVIGCGLTAAGIVVAIWTARAIDTDTAERIVEERTARPSAGSDKDCDFLVANDSEFVILASLSGAGGQAGAQVRTGSTLLVPRHWVVHFQGSTLYGPTTVPPNEVMSFWSPESCRPISLP